MAITESPFINEKELEDWSIAHLNEFMPGTTFLPSALLTTMSGKHGRPDGFAFNFKDREWFLIEAELLVHGVWPHIAEQITRFVVALRNPETLRKIRDLMFEHIVSSNQLEAACIALNTTKERLLQQIELFIEGNDPGVVIFIDETNEDLNEMAQALSMSVQIYRIKKYIVNDKAEYYSPDQNVPAIVTEQSEDIGVSISDFDVVDKLGGGELLSTEGRFKIYRVNDGSKIHVKKSKYYERHDYYWYGMTPKALETCANNGVTSIVFVMGQEGFVKTPLNTVLEFVKNTRFTSTADGGVSHYHLLISPGPEPELFWSQETPKFDLAPFYQAF